MKPIYIFSGLGADERVFKHLVFDGYEPIFIKWIIPIKNEQMEDYAKRLTNQILTNKPILVGLSFGGIMAIEVSKIIEPEKIILLATAKTINEIPLYYRIAGFLRLNQLVLQNY
jgi:esterase/lipase